MKYIVAADVGGTCTDAVIFAEGEAIFIGKALSTPPHYAEGVMNSVVDAAEAKGIDVRELFNNTRLFVHGSTVVDNTILTRDGASVGLITTKGFEDTLHMTRGGYGRWAGLTDAQIRRPIATNREPPLVSRDCTMGVSERTDYKGQVLLELDEEETEQAVRYLVDEKKVDALAICLLWSCTNPEQEKRVGEIIERVAPGVYVSLSSDVAPIPGEYERTSTAAINAYAGLVTRQYLNTLQQLLKDSGYAGPLLVMQGYGGLLPADEAADWSVGMIECGPAAGVIGSKFLGDLMGDGDIIAADMGGTTFKLGVIQNSQVAYAREPMINRYHYIAPKLDIVSIGSGGGSIVWLDPTTKVPKVGPRSAGAEPGPVCYGKGGEEPTLTDVMTLIGYMSPETFLGGSMTLDFAAAREVFTKVIAEPLDLSVEEAAIGIYRIAAAQITDLIREITVERGLDPRDFVLHAFGGTCPMLCGMFGEELQVRRILIPYTSSVNCAFGLVSADIVHEYSHTLTLPAPCDPDDVNRVFEPMIERAAKQLRDEGFDGDRIQLHRSVDLRYRRQVHEVTTPVSSTGSMIDSHMTRLIADFEALYERRYGKGSGYREAGIEMTMFRLTASGLINRPEMDRSQLGKADASAARITQRDIFVEVRDGFVSADIYDFDKIEPGNVIKGPAVLHSPISTIVLQESQAGRMDEYRNIIMEFDRGS